MAKNALGEEDPLALGTEQDAPELIKRYLDKYYETFGPGAKRNIRRSQEWFMDRINKDANLTPNHLMRAFANKRRPPTANKYLFGRLFFYKYDAKHKDTLEYWDMYPLVFFFNAQMGDGFKFGDRGVLYLWGLNLHYLPPKLRLLIFQDLITLRNERTYRAKTRLRLTWEKLAHFGHHHLYSHCVKMYRADHIMSQLVEIEPQYWELVLPMRTARFQKATQATVWKDAWKKDKAERKKAVKK